MTHLTHLTNMTNMTHPAPTTRLSNPSRRTALTTLAALLCAAALPRLAWAQAAAAAANPVVRMRGTITEMTAATLIVKDRVTNETVTLAMTDRMVVGEVYPIALSDIKPNSYIGAAAVPQPDGTQRAIAITVFPEAARGTGDGHRPFDLMPQSTMTNATVADVVAAPTGRTLQLKYKDGEKTLVVPPDAPVVTFKAADRSLLVPGASVSLSAQMIDGTPTALRVNAGRNGFVLPY